MIHYATLKKVPHMTHSSSTPNWLSTPEGQGIKAELLPWMMYRGSLTNHLTKQSGKPCQVKVLKQAWELPHKDERHFLKLDKDEKVFVREVVLYGEKDWIYARSIFPKAVMQAHEEFLKIESCLNVDDYEKVIEVCKPYFNPKYCFCVLKTGKSK